MSQTAITAAAHPQCYAPGRSPSAGSVATDLLAARSQTIDGGWFGPDRTVVDAPKLAADLKAFGEANPHMASAVRAEVEARIHPTERGQLAKETEKLSGASVSAQPDDERRSGTDVLYARANGTAVATAERAAAMGEVEVGMLRMDHTGQTDVAGVPVGGQHKLDVMTARARLEAAATPHGYGGKVTANAAMLEQQGALFVGPDAENPLAQAEGSYALMKAEAKGDYLFGHDGTRTGLIAEGTVGVAAVQGRVGTEVNVPISLISPTLAAMFGHDKTISLRAGLSGEAGSAGAGGGGHLYYDHETQRVNVGGSVLASWIFGGGTDLNISAGTPHTSRER